MNGRSLILIGTGVSIQAAHSQPRVLMTVTYRFLAATTSAAILGVSCRVGSVSRILVPRQVQGLQGRKLDGVGDARSCG